MSGYLAGKLYLIWVSNRKIIIRRLYHDEIKWRRHIQNSIREITLASHINQANHIYGWLNARNSPQYNMLFVIVSAITSCIKVAYYIPLKFTRYANQKPEGDFSCTERPIRKTSWVTCAFKIPRWVGAYFVTCLTWNNLKLPCNICV